MNYLDNYNLWKTSLFFDEETRAELSKLDIKTNKKEIEDRFYRDLEFGTAGLRGVMGAGTTMMNKYTVGKATTGFSNYLRSTYSVSECLNKGVVIAFDTRNNSENFARVTADVFSANGIKVWFCKNTSPIAVMSFAIRKLGALAGVVITASHNPVEYNGYKLYDETGCQLIPKTAKAVKVFIDNITDYSKINFKRKAELIEEIEPVDEFVSAVLKQSKIKDKKIKENLKIVYTPIHGSGLVSVCKALKKDGFSNVEVVEEQKYPNGNFPTVSSPNPEKRDALELGISKAEQIGADIVMGTDPDADRIGIAVKTSKGFKLINGNQIALLLIEFLLSKLNSKNKLKPVIISTVVSSDMCKAIAEKHGVLCLSVLTGFKYIGEKINQFETAKLLNDKSRDYDFLFGFEESYGYLAGTHVRDKDAIVTAMLIAEVAAEVKAEGKTLVDKLDDMYKEYGYYLDDQDTIVLKGKDGSDKMKAIMKSLRSEKSPFENTVEVIDYIQPYLQNEGFEKLEASDTIKFITSDGSWVAIRPSGTEPKIKIYYSVKAKTEREAKTKIKNLQKVVKEKLS